MVAGPRSRSTFLVRGSSRRITTMEAGTARSPNISLINRRRSRSAASWSPHEPRTRRWPSLRLWRQGFPRCARRRIRRCAQSCAALTPPRSGREEPLRGPVAALHPPGTGEPDPRPPIDDNLTGHFISGDRIAYGLRRIDRLAKRSPIRRRRLAFARLAGYMPLRNSQRCPSHSRTSWF